MLSIADFLGRALRIEKALDPNNPSDFNRIVSSLRNSLFGVAKQDEAKALRAALDRLDVDWKNLKAGERSSIVNAAKSVLNPSKSVLPKIEAKLSASVKDTAAGAKRASSAKYGLGIGVSLTAVDAKVLQAVAFSQGNFVRDEYGKRSEAFGMKAKEIIAEGLAQGLGSKDIGKRLHEQLSAQRANRSQAYWNVIATAFTARARTYGNLSSYQAAGITEYTVRSVLDQRTSEICRFMHGKTFRVEDALTLYDEVEEGDDPEDIKTIQPWLRSSKGQLWVPNADGSRRVVADVTKPGFGGKDRVGEYGNAMNNGRLAMNGILMPPFHGHCRTTIVPNVQATVERPAPPKKPRAPRKPKAPPEVTPPPVVAEPSGVRTPAELNRKLRDNFKNIDSVEVDDSGNYLRNRAQAEVRGALRSYVANNILNGARSNDEANRLRQRDAYTVKPANQMGNAAGMHAWDGQMMMRADYHQHAENAVKLLDPSRVSAHELPHQEFGNEIEGMRVLLHEELHGFSRIRSPAYQKFGIPLEEVAVETLARKATREYFGEKTEKPEHAKILRMPKVEGDRDSQFVSGQGRGSYNDYIQIFLKKMVRHGVPAERAARVAEDTFAKIMQRPPHESLSEPGDVAARIARQLVNDRELTEDDSKAFRKDLEKGWGT